MKRGGWPAAIRPFHYLFSGLIPCIAQHVRTSSTAEEVEVHRALGHYRTVQCLDVDRNVVGARAWISVCHRHLQRVNTNRCATGWRQEIRLLNDSMVGIHGEYDGLRLAIGILQGDELEGVLSRGT